MELTRLALAEKALAHAQAGVSRARATCDRRWNAWLEATEYRRKAQEIYAEAMREMRAASAGEGSP